MRSSDSIAPESDEADVNCGSASGDACEACRYAIVDACHIEVDFQSNGPTKDARPERTGKATMLIIDLDRAR